MSTDTTFLWNFVNWDSIWPLPHVILAYHAYMYTRNWMSVLCTYYLVKVVQLLLFSTFGLGHRHFFMEILQTTTTTLNNANRCVVDFNGLFIGGTIQTGLGIFLGMTTCHVVCPSSKNPRNFNPVHFWKSSGGNPTVIDEGSNEPHVRHRGKLALEKLAGSRNFLVANGLWPLAAIFGWLGPNEPSSAVRRWAFRKIFWKRWVQLTLLGAPALFFYTLEPKNVALRAGSVFYGFVTCLLLLVYKYINQEAYFEWLLETYANRLKSVRETSAPVELEFAFQITRNSYDSTYTIWITAVVCVILFQSIPVLTSFYKVLIISLGFGSALLLAYHGASAIERSLVPDVRTAGAPGDEWNFSTVFNK